MRRHIASLLRATFTASMLLMATEGAATAGPIEDAFTAYYSNDYATALKLVQPLAEQGNPDAGGLFGEMYEFGRGVPEDVSQAIKWYTRAANAGNPLAQLNLGVLIFSVDEAKAVRLIMQAADKGYAPAQTHLARLYLSGIGVPRSGTNAVTWYRRAAEQGYPPAQIPLAHGYASGAGGLTQDYVLAHMWFNLASANFPTLQTMHSEVRAQRASEAAYERDRIASKMTATQIAEAQKLAREWKPKPEQ